MIKTKPISFLKLCRMLEGLGYRHERVEKGEIFRQSDDRELYFRRCKDRDVVNELDLASTRRFLDAWGQRDAADFDAFLEAAPKPA